MIKQLKLTIREKNSGSDFESGFFNVGIGEHLPQDEDLSQTDPDQENRVAHAPSVDHL